MNKNIQIAIPIILILIALSFTGCINEGPPKTRYFGKPCIGLDEHDNVHIVWYAAWEPENSFDEFQDATMYYIKTDDVGKPLIGTKKLFNFGDNYGSWSDESDIRIDSMNNVHVFKEEYIEEIIGDVEFSSSIHYLKMDGDGNILKEKKRLCKPKLSIYPQIERYSVSGSTVEIDSFNNIHIVWTMAGIYYKKLDSDGNIIIDDKRLTNGSHGECCHEMRIGSDNIIYIVWEDWDEYAENSGYEKYYMELDTNGSILRNRTKLISPIGNYPIISDRLGNLLYFANNGTVDSKNNLHVFSTYLELDPITLKLKGKHDLKYTKIDCAGNKLIVNKTILEISKGSFLSKSGRNIAIDSEDNIHFVWPCINKDMYEIHYMKINDCGDLIIEDGKIVALNRYY